jgi:hypothetical protein
MHDIDNMRRRDLLNINLQKIVHQALKFLESSISLLILSRTHNLASKNSVYMFNLMRARTKFRFFCKVYKHIISVNSIKDIEKGL